MGGYRTPPMEKSDEAKPKQLDMAREQGETYVKALQHMANEVADAGGETRAGDYIVAYAIEDAEGMYHMHMRVRIEAPDFPRHDEKNRQRFAEDVMVEFEDVQIEVKE